MFIVLNPGIFSINNIKIN